ncbi:MAG TPA: alpha/beta hydrolase [Amaricoccus sp.]|uniref:alpha/beta hydrolase n=1 Tax=Amaricoccus sp. TaxID=1872485 RepID=UPI002B942FED|nr:lysophospholipase [Amaricoccus sp.]HMQ92643.1 alpha/beta hydrolase [Amaricoccus sp.]HMR52891.1 alpha/beta hydrolase [Amaricoccus sp.]HMR59247.1 alpha/beta hydrolase [Amaricoccus sp.]HMT97740.1 alpha/beta hydrolase [Amaricoccus sp.]
MKEEDFTSSGNMRIHMRSWLPEAPRAVVVICHGVNSHSGQHAWTAEQFSGRGIAAYAVDLRGRGLSDGERFYVENVSDYVDDLLGLVRIARSRHPGLPLFLLGHSAGGVVSCTLALDHQDEIDGLICESFAFQVPAPGFALAAIKGLSHIAPRLGVLSLKMKDFTRDPVALARLEADQLTKNESQPAATVAALVRADERLHDNFDKITLPVLILHGTEDKATVCHGSEFFHAQAGSEDKTLKIYEGHFHDLLNDIGKEVVFADIMGWLEARLPAFGSQREGRPTEAVAGPAS